jgi:hypothetical protein
MPKSYHFTKPEISVTKSDFCFLSAIINSFFTSSLYSQQSNQNKTSNPHYTRPHHLENYLASSYSQQQQAAANQSRIQAKDSKITSCHIASMVPHHKQQMNAYPGAEVCCNWLLEPVLTSCLVVFKVQGFCHATKG